jgi:hypothetical protein
LQFVTKMTIAGLLIGLLAGCVVAPPVTGDLKTARDACNRNYPVRIGNYLPHAHCVNAAIETYALSAARYPDQARSERRYPRRSIVAVSASRRAQHGRSRSACCCGRTRPRRRQ